MLPVMPEYLSAALLRQYGPETAAAIAEGFSARRPVTLRVNTLKTDAAAVRAQLAEAGIACETVPWYADALILPDVREDAVQALPLYERGEVYLQGLSAMLPALAMDLQPRMNLLDMAAAPGGKTTQLAALSGNTVNITACEKNKIRAERLQFNIDRQGAKHVTVMNQDARQLSDFFRFERILLDAPCTGSGTILLVEGEPQRRMDADWVRKTAATQAAMVRKALTLLPKGGELIYSTCSILECENEAIVRTALAAGAELIPLPDSLIQALPALPATLPGTLTVMPTPLTEGFFLAHLRRQGLCP